MQHNTNLATRRIPMSRWSDVWETRSQSLLEAHNVALKFRTGGVTGLLASTSTGILKIDSNSALLALEIAPQRKSIFHRMCNAVALCQHYPGRTSSYSICRERKQDNKQDQPCACLKLSEFLAHVPKLLSNKHVCVRNKNEAKSVPENKKADRSRSSMPLERCCFCCSLPFETFRHMFTN